jgi:hypothetical protein
MPSCAVSAIFAYRLARGYPQRRHAQELYSYINDMGAPVADGEFDDYTATVVGKQAISVQQIRYMFLMFRQANQPSSSGDN